MAADIKAFVRKWHGRNLEDDGCYVSKEFKGFQTAFRNAMKKVANSVGGEIVNYSNGHYDMSGFIKVGDKYIYFSYDNCCGEGGRTHIILKHDCMGYGAFAPLLIRTAKHERDYTGGTNNFSPFETCEELIKRLLKYGG